MHILNTRPTDRAATLTQLLEARGHVVQTLPLLRIEPVAYEFPLTPPQLILIFTSRNAVLHMPATWWQRVHQPSNQGWQWLAIGDATAHALRERGITAPIQQPLQATTEGLLAMACLNENPEKCAVWIITGEGGRRALADPLRARGYTVQEYGSITMGEGLTQDQVIIATRGEAVAHLCELTPPEAQNKLAQKIWILPSDRVKQQLLHLLTPATVDIRVTQQMSDYAIVQALH